MNEVDKKIETNPWYHSRFPCNRHNYSFPSVWWLMRILSASSFLWKKENWSTHLYHRGKEALFLADHQAVPVLIHLIGSQEHSWSRVVSCICYQVPTKHSAHFVDQPTPERALLTSLIGSQRVSNRLQLCFRSHQDWRYWREWDLVVLPYPRSPGQLWRW